MVTCPKCDADIDVEEDELDEGDSITCDECGGTVKVLSVDPLELEPESETGDDDDEDEDFLDEKEEEDGDEDEEEEEDEDEEQW